MPLVLPHKCPAQGNGIVTGIAQADFINLSQLLAVFCKHHLPYTQRDIGVYVEVEANM